MKQNRVPEIKYFDEINLDGRVVRVRDNVQIKAGSTPGIYPVIEIQLYNKEILLHCKVGKRIITFNEYEVLGR